MATSSSRVMLVTVLLACLTNNLLSAFVPLEKRITLHHRASRPPRLHQSFTSSEDALQVQVFDGVFTQDTCEELHYLAVEHAERGKDGSSVFYRSTENLTPLEHALNSCLEQLGDTNDICEYWSRNEYLHMDAHADIDEQELEDDERIRCPENGHVLYLNVDPSIRGPTCVFSQYGGWRAQDDKNTTLLVVPAVQGRVLRFPGSAMHAVPKPTNRWFLSDEEESALVDEDDDMWDDEEEQVVERSVILFNTWSKKGPRGVTEDYTKGAMPDGIEVDDDYIEQQKEQRLKEWQEDYGDDCRDLWCYPQSDWKEVDIVDSDSPANTLLRVSLMGKRTRRLFPQRHVQLFGPSALQAALEEDSQPSCFRLVEG